MIWPDFRKNMAKSHICSCLHRDDQSASRSTTVTTTSADQAPFNMHIQTLTIQGFKSCKLSLSVHTYQYLTIRSTDRDQTQIEPFSPGHNVVVGRNGSGKSNFFAGMRLVYQSWSCAQFLNLCSYSLCSWWCIHDDVERGTTSITSRRSVSNINIVCIRFVSTIFCGIHTQNSPVEIVFTNQPARFPTVNPIVTIRRTIGLKKDEYTLDKKSVSKADIMSLLESAGFSRSNPYYIVPQGRVSAVTVLRFQVLKVLTIE